MIVRYLLILKMVDAKSLELIGVSLIVIVIRKVEKYKLRVRISIWSHQFRLCLINISKEFNFNF